MIARSDHSSGEMVGRTRQIVTRLGDKRNTKNGHKTRTQMAKARRALKVIEDAMRRRA